MTTTEHEEIPGQLALGEAQADLLAAIDGDPSVSHEEARAVITAAIRQVARENARQIDQNKVRRLLTNEHGRVVFHKLIGPRYHAMRAQGLIARDGVNESDDALGRNGGKLQHLYRWVGSEAP